MGTVAERWTLQDGTACPLEWYRTPTQRGVMSQISYLRRILLPGFVFQSVVLAGGYGTLTWAFLAVYVVPVLTLGLWRISRPVEGSREIA